MRTVISAPSSDNQVVEDGDEAAAGMAAISRFVRAFEIHVILSYIWPYCLEPAVWDTGGGVDQGADPLEGASFGELRAEIRLQQRFPA